MLTANTRIASDPKAAAYFSTRLMDLLASDSVDVVLTGIARFTLEWMGVAACGVWWLDSSQNRFRLRLCHGDPHLQATMRGVFLPYETVRLMDLAEQNSAVESVESPCLQFAPIGAQPTLAAKISYDDHDIGIIAVFPGPQKGSWSEAERGTLRSIAGCTENACRSLDHLEKLRRLTELLNETSSVTYRDPLVNAVLDKGRQLLGCQSAAVRWVDLHTGQLELGGSYPRVRSAASLSLEEGTIGRALASGKPVRLANLGDATFEYRELWDDSRSALCVPIVLPNARVRIRTSPEFADKKFGVLTFEAAAVGAFSSFDEHCSFLLAEHMARILERLEFDDKIEKLRRHERAIVAARDWDGILDRLFQGVTETLGFEYVNFSLVDSDTGFIRSMKATGIPNTAEFRKEAMHDLTGAHIQAAIVKSRQIEVPAIDDPRFKRDLRERFGLAKFVCAFVPIQVGNEVIGTIAGGYDRSRRDQIYERDIQLLKTFADTAVSAFEFSRRGVIDRISHEVNAPLSALQNNLSRLSRRRRELSDDRIALLLDDMETDCNILFYQIQQLEYVLGAPGPLQGKEPLNLENVRLFRDIIFKTINQLSGMVRDRGLDPQRVSYEAGDVYKIRDVRVDKGKISQVIFNLFVNAVKYSASPSTFKILVGAEERPDTYVIKFADWGIGVPEELKEKIFEEGFRAPAALERNVRGSGLGLTIARRIMRDHGGDLVLHHTRNPTEFHVIFPKRTPEAQ